METTFILLGYTYYTYCQGTKDRNYGTHLIKIPKGKSASIEFNRAKASLFDQIHVDDNYEIDLDSIENLTINFFD